MAKPVSPVPPNAQFQRVDQGIDFNSPTAILAPVSGTVTNITSGWSGGTGKGTYLTFDHPVTVNGRTYTQFYTAETTPLVSVGSHVSAGTPLASQGATEIGFWPSPLIGGTGAGTQPTQQAVDFGTWIQGLGASVGSLPAPVNPGQTTLGSSGLFSPTGAPLTPPNLSIGQQVKSIGSTAAAPVTDVYHAAESVGTFLGKLTDPNFWLRALQITAGGVMILVGLYLLAKQVGLAPDVPRPVRAAAAAVPSAE